MGFWNPGPGATAGNDIFVATLTSGETAAGGDGDDTLNGWLGPDVFSGEAGNDTLIGGPGDDQLIGGDGNDSLTDDYAPGLGDLGILAIDAGAGDDEIVLHSWFLGGVIDGGAGIDQLTTTFIAPFTFNAVTFQGIEILNVGNAASVIGTAAQLDAFSTIRRSATDLTGGVTIVVTGSGTIDLASKVGSRVVTLGVTGGGATITLGGGNDIFNGSTGADTVNGGDGLDHFLGDGGNDVLRGDGGNDNLVGGAGDDTLYGGIGADTLQDTGGGDDVYYGGDGDDLIYESLGSTTAIDGGAGDDLIYVLEFGQGTVNGGIGIDTFVGGLVLHANLAFTSMETLLAGSGSGETAATAAQFEAFTTIRGTLNATDMVRLSLTQAGTVDLYSELLGRAVIFNGTSGNDGITTSNGSDDVDGKDGDDTLNGNGGEDNLQGGAGDDILNGGSGNDVLLDAVGTTGAAAINAGAGDDDIVITGNFLSGTINGSTGNDELTAKGALGAIAFTSVEILNTAGNPITGTAAQFRSFATIRRSEADTTGAVILTLSDGGVLNLANKIAGRAATVTGSAGIDVITGGALGDVLNGASGGDTLNGGDGNDSLSGGDGPDTLNGGDGNDQIEAGVGNDVISGGSGDDTISDVGGVVVSINAGAGADHITLGSTFQSGTVNGGLDSDQVTAGGSLLRDLVFVGVEALNTAGNTITATAAQMEAFETIRLNGAAASATVTLQLAAAGTINLAGELLGRAVNFTGSSGNDVITTSDGADTIDGGLGDDNINGGAGNDTIVQYAGQGHDIIRGAGGTDTYFLFGAPADETFRIMTRAEAIAAGITGLQGNTEIVITRNGTDNASVIAELDDIEEISIGSLNTTTDNGNGTVDGGVTGGDTVIVLGDFTSSSLAYSTIHIEGSASNDTVDITGLTSAHRVVFTSNGGADTVIGTPRPQDVFEGVNPALQHRSMLDTMADQALLQDFGANDGLAALLHAARGGLQPNSLSRDPGHLFQQDGFEAAHAPLPDLVTWLEPGGAHQNAQLAEFDSTNGFALSSLDHRTVNSQFGLAVPLSGYAHMLSDHDLLQI